MKLKAIFRSKVKEMNEMISANNLHNFDSSKLNHLLPETVKRPKQSKTSMNQIKGTNR